MYLMVEFDNHIFIYANLWGCIPPFAINEHAAIMDIEFFKTIFAGSSYQIKVSKVHRVCKRKSQGLEHFLLHHFYSM